MAIQDSANSRVESVVDVAMDYVLGARALNDATDVELDELDELWLDSKGM